MPVPSAKLNIQCHQQHWNCHQQNQNAISKTTLPSATLNCHQQNQNCHQQHQNAISKTKMPSAKPRCHQQSQIAISKTKNCHQQNQNCHQQNQIAISKAKTAISEKQMPSAIEPSANTKVEVCDAFTLPPQHAKNTQIKQSPILPH